MTEIMPAGGSTNTGMVISEFAEARGQAPMETPRLLHHITEACRKLDMQLGRHHMKSMSEVDLDTEGQYEVVLPEYLRAVSEIWLVNGTTEAMSKMEEKDEGWLIGTFPNLMDRTTGNQNVGTPGYWAMAPQKWHNGLGYIDDCELLIDEADVYIDDEDTVRSIYLAPAVDDLSVGSRLVVWGTHWTPKMRGLTDTNWWIEHYPSAVVWACMWRWDSLYRSDGSANAWLEKAIADTKKYHGDLIATATRSRKMQMGDQL